MNRTKRFRHWLAGKALKAAGMSFLPQWVRHSFMVPAFWRLVGTGYKGNATVFACVSTLARTFPEPELWPWLVDGGQEQKPDDHPLRQLLKKPNPDMGEAELFAFAVTYCSIGGNVYLWKQRDNGGRTIALWPFHDGHMQPIPGRNSDDGLVAYYVLDVGDGGSHNPYDVARFDGLPGVAIPKTEIVHWKWMIDPEQPWRGVGALAAAFGDLSVANEVKSYVYSLLKNDAKPPVVINLAEGDEFDEDLNDRMRKQWQQRYGGANRGTPAFLEFGMTVKELGFSMQQLEIDNLRDGPDAAICMGFGIHPAVVGAMIGLKNSTYSNYEEASRALTLQTLVPLWRAFGSEMQQSFADEPGYGAVTIRFDLAMVRSLVENQNKLREFALAAFNSAGITRGEFRQMVGQSPRAGDDVYKLGISTVFEPAGAVAAAKATPPPLQGGGGNGSLRVKLNGQNGVHSGNGRYPVIKNNRFISRYYKFPDGDGGASTQRASRKAYQRQKASIEALRQVQEAFVAPMTADLEAYFTAWAKEVEAALLKEKSAVSTSAKAALSDEMTLEDLEGLLALVFQQGDEVALEKIIQSYSLDLSEVSWPILNEMMGVDVVFDQNDPAVIAALEDAGARIVDIMETTRTTVVETLKIGADEGWSIEELANGVGDVPGIRQLVEETYKGRAETIARTELGTAQATTTAVRYRDAGFTHVIVFDNGFDNSHEVCKRLDGTVQTLEWYEENKLQHPRCVRAVGISVED